MEQQLSAYWCLVNCVYQITLKTVGRQRELSIPQIAENNDFPVHILTQLKRKIKLKAACLNFTEPSAYTINYTNYMHILN